MDRKLFGIIGIAGAGLCVAGVALAAVFMNFSPLDGFLSQLGMASGRALVPPYALFFNIGISVFGLSLGAYWVYRGLNENTWQQTVLGFLGALTGLLAVAQALFTLNYVPHHYYIIGAFYASVFVLAAAYVVFQLLWANNKRIASLIVGGLAGLCGAACAVFTLSGGMSEALTQAISQTGSGIEPFALAGWAALLLLLTFAVLLSVDLLGGGESKSFSGVKISRREIEF